MEYKTKYLIISVEIKHHMGL